MAPMDSHRKRHTFSGDEGDYGTSQDLEVPKALLGAFFAHGGLGLATHYITQWASQTQCFEQMAKGSQHGAVLWLMVSSGSGSGSGQMLIFLPCTSLPVCGPQCSPGQAGLNLGTVCLSLCLPTSNPGSEILSDALANEEPPSSGEQDGTENLLFPLVSQRATPSQSKHVKVIFQVT